MIFYTLLTSVDMLMAPLRFKAIWVKPIILNERVLADRLADKNGRGFDQLSEQLCN